MKCPQCRTENPNTRKFCRECGHRFSLRCPGCGHSNLPDDKFCGECGGSLQEIVSTISVDNFRPKSYTPRHLVDKILTSRASIEGERKSVTVMFADAADFTGLSEKLDPEDVHRIMDGCFKILMDEIHKYEGTVNQFTGDGVMAIFGAPIAHEDHAGRACHAALSIQKALKKYDKKVRNEHGMAFDMRIGLNSGPVIVGAIGDDLRMDYTAVGDTTNLAARMEQLARPGTILVSGPTRRLVKDFFQLKPLGKMKVKGKDSPQEIYELIRAEGAATRIEASVAKGLTKFVGRENSIKELMEAYEKAKNGTGQIAGIVGEAGVGKSRLVLEFKNQLQKDDYIWLQGQCVHFGSAVPYLPILNFLRSYFEIREGQKQASAGKRLEQKVLALDENLAETLSPLRDLLSLEVEDEVYLQLEPKERKNRIFVSLRNLLIRISQDRPLILVIEDLHWIDKTTEEFLNYFIGWMAGAKIMLILLYRPEYTHSWGNRSYFNRIGLNQLPPKSSAELVAAILSGGDTAAELTETILHRAAGNPLFMEELTRTLLENGSIHKHGTRYELSENTSELHVPDTVQGIIAARIDRMEEALKRVMQVASVIGKEFAFRILQAIVDGGEELAEHLLKLQEMEFIYEKQFFLNSNTFSNMLLPGKLPITACFQVIEKRSTTGSGKLSRSYMQKE